MTVNTNYSTHELEYLVRQSDIKALCLIDGFRDSDYVADGERAHPGAEGLRSGAALHSARFPRLQNVIFMGPEKHRGMYTTPELLLLGSHAGDDGAARASARAWTATT